MKDETVRRLVRQMGEDDLPTPSWNRVSLRAKFEDQFEARREPFRVLPWVQLAVYAGIGLMLAGLAVWAFLQFLG